MVVVVVVAVVVGEVVVVVVVVVVDIVVDSVLDIVVVVVEVGEVLLSSRVWRFCMMSGGWRQVSVVLPVRSSSGQSEEEPGARIMAGTWHYWLQHSHLELFVINSRG